VRVLEHFTRAASEEFGSRGISVNAVAPGPTETPFFYGQESKESAEYNQNAAALSKYTETGLTDPRDIVPLIRFLVSDGCWITRPSSPTADTPLAEATVQTSGCHRRFRRNGIDFLCDTCLSAPANGTCGCSRSSS
jgi:Enoyl-(Acyl carrier protein) reductase